MHKSVADRQPLVAARCWVVAACMCALPGLGHAQDRERVATAHDVKGDVLVTAPGATAVRRLQDESPVFSGDNVVTSRRAAVSIVFTDETQLILDERTVINVDSYRVYLDDRAAAAEDERMQMSIFRGVVRTITGALAKRRPQAIAFNTPSATIGIRGTEFVTEVDDGEVTVVLLEQDDETAPNSVEVSNAYGTVQIDQPEFGTVVEDAFTAPTPVQRMRTATMNRLLRNVNTARRVIVPRIP